MMSASHHPDGAATLPSAPAAAGFFGRALSPRSPSAGSGGSGSGSGSGNGGAAGTILPPKVVKVHDLTTGATTPATATVLYDGEELPPAVLAQRDRIVYVEIGPDGTVADLFSLSAGFQVTAAALRPDTPTPTSPAAAGPPATVLTVTGASLRYAHGRS